MRYILQNQRFCVPITTSPDALCNNEVTKAKQSLPSERIEALDRLECALARPCPSTRQFSLGPSDDKDVLLGAKSREH